MTMNGHQFKSAAISDRGLSGSRPQNEDSYLELEPHGLFAVADGVGGSQAGEVASQMAVEIIGEAFINIGPDSDPEETMRLAIERANGAIFQMSRDLPQLSSMATTVVALHIAGDMATLAHVGDSRIYRADADGRLFRETEDHSVVEEEVRAGRMTAQQALVHPSRNVISRALGAEDSVDPDVKMIIVHPASTFLLCSDGITRHIEDSEIETLLAADLEPGEICERMKQVCYDRGAEDNLTAVIIKISGARQPVVTDAADDEQITVATARSPFDSVVDADNGGSPGNSINSAEELETSEIATESKAHTIETSENLINDHDDGSYLFHDSGELFAEEEPAGSTEEYTSSSVLVPAKTETSADQLYERAVSEYPEEVETESKGLMSKAAAAIMLLIGGVLLGLAGAYFLFAPAAPAVVENAPVITEQKSNNISLTAFEEGRRAVDADPAKFIAVNPSPQVAEDYFLLARAFLLTGKYWDAKRFYGMAKERLAQAEEKNAKIMATEIAMGLAIIESPQATELFSKQAAANAAPSSASVANTNTGAAINVLPATR